MCRVCGATTADVKKYTIRIIVRELKCVLSGYQLYSVIQLLIVAYVGRVVSGIAVCRFIHVLRPNDESR
jgi:hypothetical protein